MLRPISRLIQSFQTHDDYTMPTNRRGPSSQYVKVRRGLRLFCLCPVFWGVYIHLQQAKSIQDRDARALMIMKSSALDNYVGILWCLLGGLWSTWFTNDLMQRWYLLYDLRPTMIRLFTLSTIYWFSVVSFVSYFGVDEPIWPWMAICVILAVVHAIQTFKMKTLVGHRIDTYSNLRNLEPHTVVFRRILIPGGIVSFITMMMLLHQNNTRPSSAETLATVGATAIASLNAGKQAIGVAQTQILILILTSWTPKGHTKRQNFRETTLRLLPAHSKEFAFTYKFILGEAPSSKVRESMGAKIKEEQDIHDDLLILPVSDTYEDLSFKVFKALEWSNKFKFDYLCKTDDDIFVRWDIVAQELMDLGSVHYYWRGLAYWDIMPITNPENKNIDHQFKLGVFPPFVAGSLYIFSRDVVTLLTYPGPRFFTKNEDQNIGIWLHSYNIQPIHDKRIQQWDVCENDMIAKHFSDAFTPLESMHDMYKNIVNGRPACQGFRQFYCAACYSCYGRGNHWKDWGVACDSVKGITNINKDGNKLYQGKTFVDIKDSMPTIGAKDEWILPGLLTDASSIYSDTDDWARLHWAIWTTDPATTWQPRHFQAIETLFVHNPNAVLVILSNTIPSDFFSDYSRQGYQIHILSFSKELLMKRKWFFSPNTQDWLERWDEWERAGKFFPVHLADYLRLVALYKYGGLYMDMDALWVRPPGDGMTEFIGSDVSDTDSDRAWTLDSANTYLANGVMRFQRGRSMFRHIADSYFTVTNYDPECFNCGGPKAFTSYVKAHRTDLENNGLVILPREALYPYNWKEVEAAIRSSRNSKEEILKVEQHGIGLHLYGKVTSKKAIEESSVVARAIEIWGLDLYSKDSSPLPTLQGPDTLYYDFSTGKSSSTKNNLIEKIPGAFQGVDAIFLRGAPRSNTSHKLITKRATVTVEIQKGYIAMDTSSIGVRSSQLELGENVSMAQLNVVLSKLRYLPPISLNSIYPSDFTDLIMVNVLFGEYQRELKIPVIYRSTR